MSETITRDALREAAAAWIAAGMEVAGPRRVKPGRVFYARAEAAAELLLEPCRPANSIKEFFFPRHEKLYGYRVTGAGIELFDADAAPPPQVVFAGRPCDAAALPILDRVFDWDYPDRFYLGRREASTVVTFACRESDAECFCTAVGLAPDAARGSDALLVEAGDGVFEVRLLSDKGRALFAGRTAPSDLVGRAAAPPAPQFDAARAGAFARDRFEDPFWGAATLACLGCGACAYTCPTCHCFDIADEGANGRGERVRNWDACQFEMFTLHASGHNPRATQGARQRQRIYHKFHVYPEKFGEILCTGCGNCGRNCPAGLGVLPLVTQIDDGKHLQA